MAGLPRAGRARGQSATRLSRLSEVPTLERTVDATGRRFMEAMHVVQRFLHDLSQRPSGPLGMRFVLQPIVAGFLAIRDGRKDATDGRPAYLWTVIFGPDRRSD